MTLNQILTFSAIAKYLNLSRASAACHVSQSSLTQQIKKLEEEFKTKLYRKSNRGIILTDRGEAFLRHVRNILGDIQRLNDEFSVAPAEKLKTLAVGGSSTMSAYLLQALASYRKSHPEVQLTLRTDTSLALERLVVSSELDIAVINNAPQSPELLSRPYQRDKVGIFAPPNHQLTRGSVTIRELTRVPLIIMKVRGSKTFIERLIEEHEPGIKPNITLRCEAPADVKMAVRKNMGIGVLFYKSIKTDISNGKFKLVKLSGINLDVQSYIIHRNEHSLPNHAREFIAILYRGRANG